MRKITGSFQVADDTYSLIETFSTMSFYGASGRARHSFASEQTQLGPHTYGISE